jgi:dipeptidyl aminopeptidase/acylaminoacyl peptidase
VIRKQKIPFRHNWETVVTPVVDYALTRQEVDPAKMVLMGISFGGYLVPRALAFEKRLLAGIANGGIYDFSMTSKLPPEEKPYLDSPEGAKAIDQAIYGQMQTDPSLRWSISNGMFTFHADSPSQWLKMIQKYTLKDVVSKITGPILIIDSVGDKDLPGQSQLLYDKLTTDKKSIIHFTEQDGAQEHCQMGALVFSSSKILDWVDTVTGRQAGN